MLPFDLFLQGRGFSVQVNDPNGHPLSEATVAFHSGIPKTSRQYIQTTGPSGIVHFKMHPRRFNGMIVSHKDHRAFFMADRGVFMNTGRDWTIRAYIPAKGYENTGGWLGKEIADNSGRRLSIILYPKEVHSGLRTFRYREQLPAETGVYPWDAERGLHPPFGNGEYHDFSLHVFPVRNPTGRSTTPETIHWRFELRAEHPGDGFLHGIRPPENQEFGFIHAGNSPVIAPQDGYRPKADGHGTYLFRRHREGESPLYGYLHISVFSASSRGHHPITHHMRWHLLPPGETRFYQASPETESL